MFKPRFTLIELLVSIGICLILLAILLPALNRARNLASKSSCMNNLHMIGTAINIYSFDNHDFIVPLINGMNGSCMVVKMNNMPIGLGYLIGNYGTMPENYGCPLNPGNIPSVVAASWHNKSNAQNAYFYRFDDQGFKLKLSHPENSKRSFLVDFCCIMGNKMIIAHNFEDVNCAYVDGSVLKLKNSPEADKFFTLQAAMSNGQMQTSTANLWQNADRR